MASQNRNKIYVLLIGILLVSNLAMVAFFVMSRPERKKSINPRTFMEQSLRKEAGFSDEQIKQFNSLAGQHRKEIHNLFEDLNKSKEKFYQHLNDTLISDSSLQTAAAEIGDKQEKLDLTIYKHFQDIIQIATPDQRPRLDSMLQRLVKKMISPPGRGDRNNSRRDPKN